MKKLFLSIVAAMIAATATFAQSSMLATLSHDGEISTFYGVLALRNAYNAAANGDVITLSSGSFNSVDIKKGITIRGAGMGIDSTAMTEPTVITGNFSIAIPDTVAARLTLEGIYSNHTITVGSNFKNGTFLKSRFYKIENSNYSVSNLTMIHCKVANTIKMNGNNSSVSCINCVVNTPIAYSHSGFEFLNCILMTNYYGESNIGTCSFKNCVLVSYRAGEYLAVSEVAYNCIGIGSNILFQNIPNKTNAIKNYGDIFKTFAGTYNDDENFELTEAAKSGFKGIDGSQVGIYGGNMPFSSTPSNPQITKCNVAAKSTADGKLSVDITVNGAE